MAVLVAVFEELSNLNPFSSQLRTSLKSASCTKRCLVGVGSSVLPVNSELGPLLTLKPASSLRAGTAGGAGMSRRAARGPSPDPGLRIAQTGSRGRRPELPRRPHAARSGRMAPGGHDPGPAAARTEAGLPSVHTRSGPFCYSAEV